MIRKEEEWTPHGEVEYEVAECTNCGQEYRLDDMVTVHVDPVVKNCTGASICDATHPEPKVERYICDDCSRNTLGYNPSSSYSLRDREVYISDFTTSELSFIFTIVFLTLFLIIMFFMFSLGV